MKKYISRNDAAAMLNVHPQTISNYIARGVLKHYKKSGHVYVRTEDVISLRDSDVFKQIEDNDDAMAQMVAETDAAVADMKRVCEERVTMAKCQTIATICVDSVCHAAASIVRYLDGVTEDLTPRQMDIFLTFLINCKIGYAEALKRTSDKYHVTPERIGQIVRRVVLLLSVGSWKTSLEGLKDENVSLHRRCVSQHETIEQLQHRVKELSARLQRYEEVGSVRFLTIEEEFHHLLSDIPMAELYKCPDIGVRAVNCISTMGYENVDELVSASKEEIKRCRNLGKKTMLEIDEALYEYLGVGLDNKFANIERLRTFHDIVRNQRQSK